MKLLQYFNSLFKKSIIIGVHGLSNKVPNSLLEEWWIRSIKEGLSVIGHPETSFAFKSVYWADILYENPLDIKEKNKKSPLYEDEPYLPCDREDYRKFTPSRTKKKLLDILERKIDKIFFEEHYFVDFDKIADVFIRHLYEDLDFYYNRECRLPEYKGLPVKDEIRKRLAKVLYKYRNRRILLIGHSMGSIIAYDVLTRTSPDVNIHSLITIGSPLGLPFIIRKIHAESGCDLKTCTAPSPDNIQHKWYNFSDIDDPVAVIYNIADDFTKNSRGVCPEDVIIYNNYKCNGKRNAHKLFGYLRSPEVAETIYNFCASGKETFYAVLIERTALLFIKGIKVVLSLREQLRSGKMPDEYE